MALPTFSKTGLTTFTFSRSPVFPTHVIYTPRQRLGRSDSGAAQVVTLGEPLVMHQLELELLTQTDIDGILAWFQDEEINWSAETFTYTDAASTSYTVRLAEGELDIEQIAPGVYNLRLPLVVED